MRLLHFDPQGKLLLTNFRDQAIPPYAILSHRWSGSEILLKDVMRGTYKERREGYEKLEFCAQQAAQDKLKYFWIDTCCIDKWNLDELSKSINSMFQWYRNSTRCYVFLPDVSISGEADQAQSNDWEMSFRASAWFTRGWTLQELIAPISVEFFSSQGKRIGDKASLDHLIHDITKIPLAAMRNHPLDQFTVAERRRWAETRMTTEEEDIVYCLLGVLGISMPTVYGEGQESASRRLQAEIEGIGSAPSIIPFSRNKHYVGHESYIAELEAKLLSDAQSTTKVAIVGTGGAGKSQLALELAHRVRQHNKNCSVFWVDASDRDRLFQSFASIAQKLNIAGQGDDQSDISRLVKQCLVELGKRQSLLIYDHAGGGNSEDQSLSTIQPTFFAELVPQSRQCSVLFTLTSRDTAMTLSPQHIIELQELLPGAAQKMLEGLLLTPLSDDEQQESHALLAETSCLPLAIVQAAACMKINGMNVREYRDELDKHKSEVLGDVDKAVEAGLHSSRSISPVTLVISLSISQLRHSNPIAVDYLCLAACLDCKDIPLDLFPAASSRVREDAIKVLDRYALITRRPAESAVEIHRLVRDVLREGLQIYGTLEQWTLHAVTQLTRVFPDDDQVDRSKWRRLIPHAQYALSQCGKDSDSLKRVDLAKKCARSLQLDGKYDRAEELQLQVMQTRRRLFGDEDFDTMMAMADLALTWSFQGKSKESEELNLQVIALRKKVLSHEHISTLTSMSNLAITYVDQGRFKEAEDLFAEVTETRKRVFGVEHSDTLMSMNNLAATYVSQGRIGDAERLYMEVNGMRTKLLGDEHSDTLDSMGSLATVYRKQGRLREAEELMLQVLQTRKRVLGTEHPSTLASMGALASLYMDRGLLGKAEELNIQATDLYKSALGNEHPETLTSINNLAATYIKQGRNDMAEQLLVELIQIKKRLLGSEHPDTLASMGNLAMTYWNRARWKEAEELNIQVLSAKQKTIGAEHPDTLFSLANLAITYIKQERWDLAEELGEQAIQLRTKVLGKHHPDTLNSVNNHAFTLYLQGRRKEGIQMLEECLQARQRVLGEKHPDALASLQSLKTWRAENMKTNP